MFKILIHIIFITTVFNVYAQNEYEVEDEFVSLNSKKILIGKRKINVHLLAGYNMSTAFGVHVNYTVDSLKAIKNRYGLDSYKFSPAFWPYGQIDLSINFSKVTSMTFGVKYNMVGWTEVAKYNRTNQKYLFKVRYEFHYVAIPISVQFHLNRYASIFAGHTFSFLVKDNIFERELNTVNGSNLIDSKKNNSFTTTTGIEPKKILPQFFLGGHFGIDRLRFNLNFMFTPRFIHGELGFNSISTEAGIIFKILNDYNE